MTENAAVKIIVPKVDLRGDGGSRSIDDETGRSVGQLLMGKEQGRTVILFGGKYQGTFETQAECEAFAKGVQVVLNHMVSGE